MRIIRKERRQLDVFIHAWRACGIEKGKTSDFAAFSRRRKPSTGSYRLGSGGLESAISGLSEKFRCRFDSALLNQ
jgi:hypothetical protein